MQTGNRIKILRLKQLMTQEQLAEKVGIAPATLSRIENNKHSPSLSTLRELTKALNIDVTELVDFEKE